MAVFPTLCNLIGKADCLFFISCGIKAKPKVQKAILLDQLRF